MFHWSSANSLGTTQRGSAAAFPRTWLASCMPNFANSAARTHGMIFPRTALEAKRCCHAPNKCPMHCPASRGVGDDWFVEAA